MGSLWTDRQKIPDPEHPIPPDPPQPDDPFRRGPRQMPRIVTAIVLVLVVAAILIILGAMARVIAL